VIDKSCIEVDINININQHSKKQNENKNDIISSSDEVIKSVLLNSNSHIQHTETNNKSLNGLVNGNSKH